MDFQSCLKNPHLVADRPVMLNDVVIAVVVFVVVTQVAVVMLGKGWRAWMGNCVWWWCMAVLSWWSDLSG